MRNSLELTVRDVFDRPNFQNAEVVAGEKGLSNLIRWIHILEVTEIGHLLNGDELILTTGVGWKENQELSLSLLQQLIDKKVSGLCVELGTYIDSIPADMIDLANKHNFPIIVFKEEVRFIDITQDLNGLLMDAHYKMMLKLEAISNQLNQLLLTTDGFKRILRLLYQSINVQVAYVPVEGEMEFYPPIDKSKEKQMRTQVESTQPKKVLNSTSSSASKVVQALGHKFADLVILSKEENQVLTDFDYLVLDRVATALSQNQLRLLYVEEKRKHQEDRWLLEWLNGKHEKEQIEQYLSRLDPLLKPMGGTVCICETNLHDQEADLTYFSLIFREIFKQQGFYALSSIEGNNLVFGLVNQRDKEDWKLRLSNSLEQMKKTDLIKTNSSDKISFGVGKLYELDQLHNSYVKAKETLYIKNKINNENICFYEDLYVYQLILKLNKQNNLQEFTDDYLGPVLEFDRNKNGEMLETLKVLLEVNGSKKDAAERLFVVRQTLYHRIEKLKELLGDDFMEGEKRLAIQFAVYSRSFLEK